MHKLDVWHWVLKTDNNILVTQSWSSKHKFTVRISASMLERFSADIFSAVGIYSKVFEMNTPQPKINLRQIFHSRVSFIMGVIIIGIYPESRVSDISQYHPRKRR